MKEIIILILATYKLSHLFAFEDGPFEVLDKFRKWSGVKVSEYGEMYGTNQFSIGLICMECNSIWIGIATTIFFMYSSMAIIILFPFAIGGAITLVNNYV